MIEGQLDLRADQPRWLLRGIDIIDRAIAALGASPGRRGRCWTILVLDPRIGPGLLLPAQSGIVRRISPPHTIPQLMQHIRRARASPALT